VAAWLAAAARAAWTDERKTRIRLAQWSITLGIYFVTSIVIAVGVHWGLVDARAFAGWCVCVVAGLAVFYALIRSGASRRAHDPALTAWQIGFSVVAAIAGYALCGDVRSAALFPLPLIMSFGAFSLRGSRIAALTAFALTLLAAEMLAMHTLWPGRYDPRVDVANFVIAAIVLPSSSILAGLLGGLRERLRAQREALAEALARIQDLATRDELTGLPNRRHLQGLLDFEFGRCSRAGGGFSVALIDLDHFKRINDRHGHAAGDRVLQRFAEVASSELRGCDALARWGGEEFLLLMPGTSQASARSAVERLRERIAQLPAGADDGPAFTLSAGVAEHRSAETVAETLSRADQALYAAKAAGRNRVHPPEEISAA